MSLNSTLVWKRLTSRSYKKQNETIKSVDGCLQGFQNLYEAEKYPLFDHLFRGGCLDRHTVHHSIHRQQTQRSGNTSNLYECLLVLVCHWRRPCTGGDRIVQPDRGKGPKSLEPLLATPTTDEEILAGKSIAAFLPAIGSNYIGALIFMVLADLFTYSTLKLSLFPQLGYCHHPVPACSACLHPLRWI